MGNSNASPDEQFCLFVFSYNEHDRLDNISDRINDEELSDEEMEELLGEEAEIAALLQEAETGEWISGSDSDFSFYSSEKGIAELLADGEVHSHQELLALAQSVMVDEYEWSLEVAQAVLQKPIAKLQTLMSQENWTFVRGTFYGFDGHHNDTTLLALLKKASDATL
jgi:hypothetical protein